MVLTASSLVTELGYRLNELVLSVPTSPGTTSTLVDSALVQYYPSTIPAGQFNVWVVGSTTADTLNRGVIRRATSWNSTTRTLALYSPMATAITTGTYLLHQRTDPTRKLEALNSGVRHLGYFWARPLVDTTLTTASNTWSYTLPNTTLWTGVSRFQIQISTSASLPTFPYADMTPWDGDVIETTDASGVTTWKIQFATLPPPGRTIRIYGEAEYPDLVNDTDILPVAAQQAGRVKEWLLKWARYTLHDWETERDPAGMTARDQQAAQRLRQEAYQDLLMEAPPHPPNRIIVPGRGTGVYPGSAGSSDPTWLAGLRSP